MGQHKFRAKQGIFKFNFNFIFHVEQNQLSFELFKLDNIDIWDSLDNFDVNGKSELIGSKLWDSCLSATKE